jgi:hypothetical protein
MRFEALVGGAGLLGEVRDARLQAAVGFLCLLADLRDFGPQFVQLALPVGLVSVAISAVTDKAVFFERGAVTSAARSQFVQ